MAIKRGPGRPRKNPEAIVTAPKRGPGRPRKDGAPVSETRGRKPGIKNKSFTAKLSGKADALETAILGMSSLLVDAIELEGKAASKELTEAGGLIMGMTDTLQQALATLVTLPLDFTPGKSTAPIAWEAGAYAVFKEEFKAAFGHTDAYHIVEVISLGQGPGRGTMIRLEGVGIFSKNQLELVDASQLEEGPPLSAPVQAVPPTIRRNGASFPAHIASAMPDEESEDLNA